LSSVIVIRKTKTTLAGSSMERCGLFGAFSYALRLPPRSWRHAHQVGVGKVISFRVGEPASMRKPWRLLTFCLRS
jgi:hypothetical protein